VQRRPTAQDSSDVTPLYCRLWDATLKQSIALSGGSDMEPEESAALPNACALIG
jgi:hypothetical protein